MYDQRKVRPSRVDFPHVINTEAMKRIFVISLLALLTSSLMAQYVGDGYYRVRNKATSRYIYVLDNTGSINVSTTSADMGAIKLHKDTARWHHDPACIIYAHQVSNGKFDLKAQGTGVHDIIGYYVEVYQKSDGSYQVYAEGKYLCDNETNLRFESSNLGTDRTGDYRCWYVNQVNNTDQYFGVLPTIQLGNKYYKPFYASFPFSLVSSGMKVYYISAVYNNAAIIAEATGTIPASTPVFIECASPDHWNNRINIGGTATATISSNKLRGVYFNNPSRQKSRDARTAYNPVTMRTLAVSPEGKLCYVKNTSLSYLPANESYLSVPSTAEDTLLIMTADEYRVYTTAASISLDRTSLDLFLDETATLSATVLPVTTLNKTVQWTSSNPSVATVSQQGLVSALAVGTTTITAKTTDGSNLSATCAITVNPVLATGLTLSRGVFSGIEGDTARLTAMFVPANTSDQRLIWASSDTTVALVDNGLITLRKVGMATITATTVDGTKISASCTVTSNPIPAQELLLSQNVFTGVAGDTLTLRATVLPANTTNKSVTWKTSNPSVATVAEGLVKIVSVGSAVITATTADGSNLSATCAVTANPILVTSLSLSQESFSGIVGDTVTLVATALPANATNKGITWTTSNSAVATVTNGLVTIQSVGTAIITATARDGSGLSATCSVVGNPVMVSEIQLTQTSGPVPDSLHIGDRVGLSATVLPANATSKAISWESSNPSVLRIVSQTNTACSVLALVAGESVITASALDGSEVSAQIAVTVLPTLATSLALAQDSILLSLGDSLLLPYTLLPAETTDKSLLWTTSEPAVLTVDSTGLCRAVGVGSSSVTVSTLDGSGLSASCFIQVADTVIPPTLAESLLLSLTSADLLLGDSLALSCTVLPLETSDKSIRWSSSDTTVLTVDSTGLCRSLAVGSATISVVTLDGSNLTATCEVTVRPILAEVVASSCAQQTLHVGDTFSLSATVLPANTTNPAILWTSSDTTVVTVDSLGFCTAVNLGVADIIVSTLDGSNLSDTCHVSVVPILAETLTISRSEAELHVGDTIGLTYTLLPANITDPSVRWTSSDPSVLTVDSLGVCTAVGLGTAAVIVSTLDGSNRSDSCIIWVSPILAESLSLSQPEAEMHVGDELNLTYTLLPANTTDPSIRWTSSDTTVLTVDSLGHCQALALGLAQVSVATLDGSGLVAYCSVRVTPVLADSLVLTPQELTLTIGDSASLSAEVFPATTTNPTVLWQTSAPEIVSVDEQGRICALSVGEAVITVSTTDGSSLLAECTVTVNPIWVTSIVLSADSLSLYEDEWAMLVAIVLPENATFREVDWQSSDETVVTVTPEGRVTGVHTGKAVIQVVAVDGSGVSASCAVEVSEFTDLLSLMAADPDSFRIYDILGRPLSTIPNSGLYIVNGKVMYIIKK